MDAIQKQLQQYAQSPTFQQHYHQLVADTLADADVRQFLSAHQEQVNDEVLRKSHAKLYEYVQEKKRIATSGQSQNPGFTPVLLWHPAGYVDIAYEPTEAFLAAEQQRQLKKLVQAMDMPKDIEQAQFSQLDITPERRTAILAAEEFVRQFQHDRRKGLYVYGDFGVGKTYLLGAIANSLVKQYHVPVILAHFPSLVVELKQSLGQQTTGDKLAVIKQAPVLFLDDIGAETMTPWVRDDVLAILLEYRMKQQLPTLFSSNKSFAELEQHLRSARNEVDEVKAKRLMQRFSALSTEVHMGGVNRRH